MNKIIHGSLYKLLTSRLRPGYNLINVLKNYSDLCITQFYIMNVFGSFHENKHEEKNFQEFLARLIVDIPQLLLDCQKILFLKHKREDYLVGEGIQQMKIKLSKCNFQCGTVIHSGGQVNTPKSSSNIYKRFRFRLLEAIMPFKHRYEASDVILFQLGNVLKGIDKAVYSLQEDELSFADFLTEISNSFQIFLSSINEGEEPKIQSPLKMQGKNIIKISNGGQKSDGNSKSLKTEPEYHMQLKKMLVNLNQRFKTISCLDLDYNHFRSSFFEGKNSSKWLFDQYMERNKNTKALRVAYSKEFKQYLQRREKRRIMKRASLIEKQSSQRKRENSVSKSFRLNGNYISKKTQPITSMGRQSHRLGSFAEGKSVSMEKGRKRFSFADPKQKLNLEEDFQPQKVEYEMKNVLITAQNLQFFGSNEMTKYTLKNTLRQLQMNKKRTMRSNDKGFFKSNKDVLPKFRFQQ